MKKISYSDPALSLAVGLTAAACSTTPISAKVDTDKLNVPDGSVVYVTDVEGKRKFSSINSLTLPQHSSGYSPAAAADCNVTFAYDPSVLADYNSANATRI